MRFRMLLVCAVLLCISAGCGGFQATDPQLRTLRELVVAVEVTPTIEEHLVLLEFVDTIDVNPDWQATLNNALGDVRSHKKKWSRYSDDRKGRLLDLFVMEARFWHNVVRNLPKDR